LGKLGVFWGTRKLGRVGESEKERLWSSEILGEMSSEGICKCGGKRGDFAERKPPPTGPQKEPPLELENDKEEGVPKFTRGKLWATSGK